ncbi:MAG: hypothetical protein QME74_07660 [Candidatus Edwardsbacteria bacterium]|nr:hypothetical protein [Candidatus Edwardsbacteria bacterium]
MNELYRTYEVLIEEMVHPDHPKRNASTKPATDQPDTSNST